MAKKEVGYIELEWICPNCSNRNKGSVTTCSSCGAAQPQNVQFVQPLQTELIKDAEQIIKAEAGPDIHCAFCGARNPSGTKVCTNCGADLVEGKRREAGRVIGSYQEKTGEKIKCPACGETNPATNQRCSNCGSPLIAPQRSSAPVAPTLQPQAKGLKPVVLFGIIGAVLICIIVSLALIFRTSDEISIVVGREWQRAVVLEQYGPVTRRDWRSDIPVEGNIETCQERQRSTSPEPLPGSREVCGTPYTVDEGSGFGKVVQDCVYEVYEEYCSYQIDDWSKVDQIVVQGSNNLPDWPDAQIQSNQRLGERSETYEITFDSDGTTRTYTTSDIQLYQQATVGSQWILTLNGLGAIVDITPSN
jgi:hypothetical protein